MYIMASIYDVRTWEGGGPGGAGKAKEVREVAWQWRQEEGGDKKSQKILLTS